MKCPRCGSHARVLDTRKGEYYTIKRRRECENGHIFHTTEMVNAGVHRTHLKASAAATLKRIRLWHRDITIAQKLAAMIEPTREAAARIGKFYNITWSAVYQAAQRGRKYARK